MLSSRSVSRWPRRLMMALAVMGSAVAVAQNIDVTKEEFPVEVPSPFAPAKKVAISSTRNSATTGPSVPAQEGSADP